MIQKCISVKIQPGQLLDISRLLHIKIKNPDLLFVPDTSQLMKTQFKDSQMAKSNLKDNETSQNAVYVFQNVSLTKSIIDSYHYILILISEKDYNQSKSHFKMRLDQKVYFLISDTFQLYENYMVNGIVVENHLAVGVVMY